MKTAQAHSKQASKAIWADVKANYPLRTTPKSLAEQLTRGVKDGQYLNPSHTFYVAFRVMREDKSAWVVDTDRVAGNGAIESGAYYVSKKKPKQCVFD